MFRRLQLAGLADPALDPDLASLALSTMVSRSAYAVLAMGRQPADVGELSELYRIAPLGSKPPDALETVFGHSMFACFVYAGDVLAGAGRALADGLDCAYIADVAVHPEHQGRGLGSAIIRRLVALADGHKKIILYANPGTEGFYRGLGFLRMNTAMAIWSDPARAIESGLLSAQS